MRVALARAAPFALASLGWLTLLAPSCGARQRPRVVAWPGDVAFVDVTVVPMDRDGSLSRRTVLVRGDRIVAIESVADVELPPGVTRIDGRGKWLMPGLADMHVHAWNPDELTMFVAAGVTSIRNMWGTELHLEWRTQIERGEILGPRIVTAGPIVDGDPPIWPGSRVIVTPDEIDAFVAEQKQAGYDFVKPYSRLDRDVYDALVDAGARHGLPIAGHVPREVGLAHALESRQRSIEHLDGWIFALVPEAVSMEGGPWKALGRALPRVDAARLPALIQATLDAGTWNCPTMIVWDRISRMDDPDGLTRSSRWIDLVPHATRARWDPRADFRLRSMDADDFATLRAANALRARIVAELARAGAPLLVGTDAGNPFVIPGAGLHDEIELLIQAGVPRPAVLRAATAGAAEYLGSLDAGVVRVGARADLILVGVDPLASPLPLPPDGVVVGGRWIGESEIRERLDAIARDNE